jgi:hypothetical protein
MNNYVVVQDWMLDLDLTASELLAFALIWGFTQDGRHSCHPSLTYIGRFCGLKERATISRMLKRIADKGYLIIDSRVGELCEYSVNLKGIVETTKGIVETTKGVVETTKGVVETTKGVVETTNNNNTYNTTYNTTCNTTCNTTTPTDGVVGVVENPGELFAKDETSAGVNETENIPTLTGKKSKSKYKGEGFHFKQIPADPGEVQRFVEKYTPSLDWKDFYNECERSGWRYGKNNRPIKDWRAEIYAWVRYRAKKQQA